MQTLPNKIAVLQNAGRLLVFRSKETDLFAFDQHVTCCRVKVDFQVHRISEERERYDGSTMIEVGNGFERDGKVVDFRLLVADADFNQAIHVRGSQCLGFVEPGHLAAGFLEDGAERGMGRPFSTLGATSN